MKRFRMVCAVIPLILLLSGCVGKEPNEMSYIVAFGIDKGENGNYKITIQYANPSEIIGSEEGVSTEESGVENITLETPNIYSAVGLADQLDSKSFSISHTKLIVVSRETAEDGMINMVEDFIRNEELRPDVFLAVAEEGAQEFLEGVNSSTEVNTAKYYRMIFDKDKFVGLPEGIIKNFFCGTTTGDYDSLLPITHNDKDKNIGSAVFRDGKMVGRLNEHETKVFKLLIDSKVAGFFTLSNNSALKEPVTIRTVQKKAPKYTIDHKEKSVYVKLTLEGDLYAVSQNYDVDTDLEDFEKLCEEYVADECRKLMEKVIKEYKSDIFRLNERSKPQFMTNEDYEDFKKRVSYDDYDITVEVSYDIRRTGLIVKRV